MSWFKNKTEESRKVFGCKFKCNNCGFSWEDDFEKGVDAIQKEDVVILKKNKEELYVDCTNCGSKNVKVIKRFYYE